MQPNRLKSFSAVFLLRLEEEYWRSPFLKINFIGVNFEAGNETREKIWILLLNKMKSGALREWFFCSYRCLLESENLRCEKNSVSERKFLFVRHFKAVFFIFLVKMFGYDFVLILGWFW